MPASPEWASQTGRSDQRKQSGAPRPARVALERKKALKGRPIAHRGSLGPFCTSESAPFSAWGLVVSAGAGSPGSGLGVSSRVIHSLNCRTGWAPSGGCHSQGTKYGPSQIAEDRVYVEVEGCSAWKRPY